MHNFIPNQICITVISYNIYDTIALWQIRNNHNNSSVGVTTKLSSFLGFGLYICFQPVPFTDRNQLKLGHWYAMFNDGLDKVVEIMAWASNNIPLFYVNVITYLCHEFDAGLYNLCCSGPLFTTRTVVLSQDPVKSRSRLSHVETSSIALKFDRHIDSSSAEMPVKFQRDTIIITPNLATSILHEIWR